MSGASTKRKLRKLVSIKEGDKRHHRKVGRRQHPVRLSWKPSGWIHQTGQCSECNQRATHNHPPDTSAYTDCRNTDFRIPRPASVPDRLWSQWRITKQDSTEITEAEKSLKIDFSRGLRYVLNAQNTAITNLIFFWSQVGSMQRRIDIRPPTTNQLMTMHQCKAMLQNNRQRLEWQRSVDQRSL